MISKKFGFIQGRISSPPSKKVLQFFPQKNWKKEITSAKKHGFTFIEYIGERKFNKFNPIWNKQGVKQIISLSRKSKIKNYSFCDDFFINNNLIKYNYLDQYIDKIINQLVFLKIKIYVLALFEKSNLNKKNFRNYVVIVDNIAKKLKKAGIKLALETNLDVNYLIKFFKFTKNNNSYIVYDTGNRLGSNFKQYLEILKLKKKIIHIHLKDKNFLGENVVMGTGNVDFALIFKSLKKINYRGNFVFETNRGINPITTMKNNLIFIKSIALDAGYKI
jgi:L-ribulose-5-phosphate 3-epimerase/hexulose-6-phosphate isomerase